MSKYPWILNLPENSPKDFGLALKNLAFESFNLERKGQASAKLAEELAISRRIVQIWLKGGLHNERSPLTMEHFHNLIALLWKKWTLEIDEIIALTRCAGEDYYFEIQKSWFKELTDVEIPRKHLPLRRDQRYPLPNIIIPREDILNKIRDYLVPALQQDQPIIIYAQPGMGKTTLVEQLEKEYRNKFHFHLPDGVLSAYLGGAEPDMALLHWLTSLHQGLDFSFFDQEKIRTKLKEELAKNPRRLVLIDDVQEINYANIILDVLPAGTVKIITTNRKTVADHFQSQNSLHINMQGFSTEETRKYYEAVTRVPNQEITNKLDIVRKIFNGNPLALFSAFKLLKSQKNDWGLFLQLLDEMRVELPKDFRDSAYLVQKVLYERVLSTEQQQYFRAMGALPKLWEYDLNIFMALWDTDAKLTHSILNALEYDGGVIKSPAQGTWRIHGSILGVAKEYLDEDEDLLVFSVKWIERAKQRFPKLKLTSVPGAVFQAYKNRKVTTPAPFKKNLTWKDYLAPLYKHLAKSWNLVKKNSAFFTAKEYILAAKLDEKDSKTEKLWRIFAVILWGYSAIGLLARGSTTPYASLITSPSGVVSFLVIDSYIITSAFIDYIRIPATWRAILLKGIDRHQENIQNRSSTDSDI